MRDSWRGFVVGSMLTVSACGGGTAAPGSGGMAASGGSAAGGQPASGGAEASGGESSSGGAAGSGGTAPAAWDEVRCWQNDTVRGCYARIGNLWTVVSAMCQVEGAPREPMTQNQEYCYEPDDAAGWDETWCNDGSCYGRLGDWFTGLYAACQLPGGSNPEQTPTEALCGAAPEEPTGWEDVRCWTNTNPTVDTNCYGLLGLYFPAGGLVPLCQLEAQFAGKPYIVEVAAEPTCDW